MKVGVVEVEKVVDVLKGVTGVSEDGFYVRMTPGLNR
jgi:hypothetical protein